MAKPDHSQAHTPVPGLPDLVEPIADQLLAAPQDEAGELIEHPLPRVGARFIAVYMFTYFGFNLALLMLTLFSVAYKVQLLDPAAKGASLGLVLGIGGLFGLVTGPIAGVFSDGTRLRWGRRRPWLIGGIVLLAIGGTILAVAPLIVVAIGGYAIMQIGISAVSAGFNPVLAEQVPAEQRGKLGALGGLAASIAGVASYSLGGLLTASVLLLFLLPVIVFAVGSVLFVLTIKDQPAPADARVQSVGDVFRSFVFNPRKSPDFGWVWLGKFFLQFGFTFFSTYQLYVLLDRLGFTAAQAGAQLAIVGGLSLVATIGFALLSGFLSDKLRRRKPFIYAASIGIAAGLVIVSVAPNFPLYIVGGVILAAGSGSFTPVDLAMATDVLPEKDKAGKYMGIYYLASSVPGTVAPLLAPLLLVIGSSTAKNYFALFITGALLALGALLTTSRIRAVR